MNKLSTYFWYVLKLAAVLLCVILSSKLVAGPKDLLIIHSYSRSGSFTWVDDQTNGIKSIFGKRGYQFHEFELSTKTIPESQFEEKASAAYKVVKQVNPGLIFLTDDNALKLMVPKIGKNIPIVFAGVNGNIRTDYPWLLKYANVTGILERPLMKRTIFQMKDALNLNLKKVLVIMGTSPTGKAFFKNDLNGEDKFRLVTIDVDVRRSGKIEEWYKWISESKEEGYNLLLVTNFYALTDSNGNKIDVEIVANWISNNSPLPAFSVHTGVVGKNKLIGGMVISGVHMGEAAGKLALDILINKKSSAIFYKTLDRGQLIFSKHQLTKWNLTVDKRFIDEVVMVD
ncbi:hypothetical protein H0A36_03025 [Endozoicomonas sp. SM1973]|uniref:ABC-type sugar transport system, ATPase component n=1 Tax=Spartinivicinus marinus TaxID=2994442 RepID=A0A853I6X4_9GAMM|nr:hypothetical protein [Spartinivicinus marinus]MCX4029390.1 hypothetical protein [Spartinivicinus marinus]NYZ64965.1 hypothetical protein [Spartinivicinus marinus]